MRRRRLKKEGSVTSGSGGRASGSGADGDAEGPERPRAAALRRGPRIASRVRRPEQVSFSSSLLSTQRHEPRQNAVEKLPDHRLAGAHHTSQVSSGLLTSGEVRCPFLIFRAHWRMLVVHAELLLIRYRALVVGLLLLSKSRSCPHRAPAQVAYMAAAAALVSIRHDSN